MTDKDELIKAAETIKNYCKSCYHCDIDCILASGCKYLYQFNNLSEYMEYIINSVRYSDD